MLLLYILLYWALAYFFIKQKNRRLGSYDDFDPFTIFVGAFFIYCSIGAFDRIELADDTLTTVLFYLSSIVGLLSFSISYNNSVEKNKNSLIKKKFSIGFVFNKKTFNYRESRLMLLAFIAIVAFNVNSFIGIFTNFGTGVSYVDISARDDRTAFSGPAAFIAALFGYFMIGYPIYNIIKTQKATLIDFTILVSYCIFCLASGFRTSLLLVFFAIILIINNYIFRIKMRHILIGSIAGLFFMVLLGHLRSASNVKDMLDILNSHGKELFVLASSGEFFNTVDTCFTYIALGEFDFGMAWVRELEMFIPTFLWPSRPLPLPEEFMKIFYSEAPDGTGHGWFIMTDGYKALGVIGVVLEFYIIGKVLSKGYNYFMKRRNSALHFVMYIFMIGFVFLMMRASFISAIKLYILSIVPFMIIKRISTTKFA